MLCVCNEKRTDNSWSSLLRDFTYAPRPRALRVVKTPRVASEIGDCLINNASHTISAYVVSMRIDFVSA